jgi:hypothetical protein
VYVCKGWAKICLALLVSCFRNSNENTSKIDSDDDNYQLAFWRLGFICKHTKIIFLYQSGDTVQSMQLMGAESQSAVSGGVSTQVLDLVRGVPVSRMAVTLWLECGNSWTQISEG